jgi:hypothetical protein
MTICVVISIIIRIISGMKYSIDETPAVRTAAWPQATDVVITEIMNG